MIQTSALIEMFLPENARMSLRYIWRYNGDGDVAISPRCLPLRHRKLSYSKALDHTRRTSR